MVSLSQVPGIPSSGSAFKMLPPLWRDVEDPSLVVRRWRCWMAVKRLATWKPVTGAKTSHWCCSLWLQVCLKKCGIARNRGIQRLPSNWQLGHQIAGIQQFDDPAASTSNWRRVPTASRLVVLCSFYLNSTPFQVQVEEPWPLLVWAQMPLHSIWQANSHPILSRLESLWLLWLQVWTHLQGLEPLGPLFNDFQTNSNAWCELMWVYPRKA